LTECLGFQKAATVATFCTTVTDDCFDSDRSLLALMTPTAARARRLE
jgi:hypothetical protein